MDGMRLFEVNISIDATIVVAAKDELGARRIAEGEANDVISDEHPWVHVDGELTAEDKRHLSDDVYGVDDIMTVAEFFEKQQQEATGLPPMPSYQTAMEKAFTEGMTAHRSGADRKGSPHHTAKDTITSRAAKAAFELGWDTADKAERSRADAVA